MQHDYQQQLAGIDAQLDGMHQQLIEWSETNSGSLNLPGLATMAELIKQGFQPLGVQAETLDLKPLQQVDSHGQLVDIPLGQALRWRKRPAAPIQIFLGGHYDTVFPVDSSFQKTKALDPNTLNGPGVADLKGGLLVMRAALQTLEQSPWAENVGWEILLNPDEEIGSPGSAPLLIESAKRNHIGLVYEPAMPDGGLAGARKGSGNFSFVVRGRAAHAGREHHQGRNAIAALALFISAVDQLNGQREGVTINVGKIEGGGPVNVVPDLAICRFNVRLHNEADQQWFMLEIKKAAAILDSLDGIEHELHGGFTRPAKPLSDANQRLFERLRDCGAELNQEIRWQATGGCCDGNNLAAAGLPNIDTLGVIGGAIHSDKEYMFVDSLVSRAKLSALLLLKIASGEIDLHKHIL